MLTKALGVYTIDEKYPFPLALTIAYANGHKLTWAVNSVYELRLKEKHPYPIASEISFTNMNATGVVDPGSYTITLDKESVKINPKSLDINVFRVPESLVSTKVDVDIVTVPPPTEKLHKSYLSTEFRAEMDRAINEASDVEKSKD